MSDARERPRALLISRHIGAISCYRALFSSWGWSVDVLGRAPMRNIHGWYRHLPLFIETTLDNDRRRNRWRRSWLLGKWQLFHRLLIRSRHFYGETLYIALLNWLHHLRLIDDRWYLHGLLPDWNMRADGLSPEVRRALAHPAVARLMKSTDVVVTSYCLGHCVDLADALHQIYGVKVIAISAHRFNQFKQERAGNEKLKSDTRRLAATAGCVKAVCDEYDWHYERRYLGIDAHRLWARPFHIRPERVKAMDSDVVLLTPIRKSALGSRLQAACKRRYDQKALKPNYILEEMDRQPRFDTPEGLGRYSAFIVVPYSAYAIMHFEFYALNRPIFIPSVELIVEHGAMWDRALSTSWCPQDKYREMEDDIDAPDSPNSLHPDAQRLWVARSFLHRAGNAQVFESADDLFDKLERLESDRPEIERRMRADNRRLDAEALAAWDRVLQELQLPPRPAA